MAKDCKDRIKFDADMVKVLNEKICAMLSIGSETCISADASDDCVSYHLNYDDVALLDATIIFTHVLCNIGIKNGHITQESAKTYGNELHDLILRYTGKDTHQLVKEQIKKRGGD